MSYPRCIVILAVAQKNQRIASSLMSLDSRIFLSNGCNMALIMACPNRDEVVVLLNNLNNGKKGVIMM